MANNWYVRSGAAGGANGSTWTDAYVNLSSAMAASNTANGDFIWVSEDHNEVAATINLNSTSTNFLYILCANHTSGHTPPVIATDLQTTANIVSNTTIFITNGNFSAYGLNFYSGQGTASAQNIYFDFMATSIGSIKKYNNCSFSLNVINNSRFYFGAGAAGTLATFNNCAFNFGNTAQAIQPNGGDIYFNQTTFGGSFVPTNLIWLTSGAGAFTRFNIKKCDFSNFTAGKFIFSKNAWGVFDGFAFLEDCIVNSANNLVNTPSLLGFGSEFYALRCISPFSQYFATGAGVMQDSNTTFRVGGASDGIYSRSKMISTFGNTSTTFPFTPLTSLVRYSNVINQPLTATIYGTWGATTVPNNSVIWLNVEYFGNTTTTLGSTVSSGQGLMSNSGTFFPGQITANANVDSTSTWTAGGANSFSISVTFTPKQAGPLRASISVGQNNIADGNLFIDPILYIRDASNNLLFGSTMTFDSRYGTISETGVGAPVGASGLIIQGI